MASGGDRARAVAVASGVIPAMRASRENLLAVLHREYAPVDRLSERPPGRVSQQPRQ